MAAVELIAMLSYPAAARLFCSREGLGWEGGLQIGIKTGVLLSSSAPLGLWQSDVARCACH